MSSTRVRGTKTGVRQKRQRQKKACPDGQDCKYQHEHQHTEEYDHPPRGAPAKPKPVTWGQGRTLGRPDHGSHRGSSQGRGGAGISRGGGAAGSATTVNPRRLGGATAGKSGGLRRVGKEGGVRVRIPETSRLLQLASGQSVQRTGTAQRTGTGAPTTDTSLPRPGTTSRPPDRDSTASNGHLSEAEALARAIADSLDKDGTADAPIQID
eukprot:m.179747 g.179747  ORF g.179747 m.179747 type:complete len:210 (-) comp14846_c0_seq1:127-756(-)